MQIIDADLQRIEHEIADLKQEIRQLEREAYAQKDASGDLWRTVGTKYLQLLKLYEKQHKLFRLGGEFERHTAADDVAYAWYLMMNCCRAAAQNLSALFHKSHAD